MTPWFQDPPGGNWKTEGGEMREYYKAGGRLFQKSGVRKVRRRAVFAGEKQTFFPAQEENGLGFWAY